MELYKGVHLAVYKSSYHHRGDLYA